MDSICIQEIAEITQAELTSLSGEALSYSALKQPISKVVSDSRKAGPGDLFIPLAGASFDGHEFISQVATKVAASFVERGRCSQVQSQRSLKATKEPFPLLMVDSVEGALQALAKAQRQKLRADVIGITGSVGKTTVKDFLGQILGSAASTIKAQKSFNNHIGVPLTLLEADQRCRFVVNEMGTSGPGEISFLGDIVRPDIAIVTAIAPAHLSGLGSLDGVVEEKSAIFDHLQEGGLAFLPSPIFGENRFYKAISKRSGQLIRYGWARNDLLREGYWITGCRPLAQVKSSGAIAGYEFEVNGTQRFTLNITGKHNVENALAAIAVSRELGLDWQTIRTQVAALTLPPLRLQLSTVGGVQILNDTYNSNPASFQVAVQSAQELILPPGGKWYLVLGDFLELGEASQGFHSKIGEELATKRIFDGVFTVGSQARLTQVEASRGGLPAYAFSKSDSQELLQALSSVVKPGDGVLFKASRGIQLELAVNALKEQLESGNRLSKILNSRYSQHALLRS